MSKKKIIITGTAGLLGPHVARHFAEHGYHVVGIDRAVPKESAAQENLIVDLTNAGEVYSALSGAMGVVHLAAIPRPGIYTSEVTFGNNILASYHILEAADNLGIKKTVIASSESAYGFCFSKNNLRPQYFPVDEEHPALAEDSYGIGKIAAEKVAEGIHRRNRMQIITFRLGNIITEPMYENFKDWIHDPHKRVLNVWNYIDARDIASACRLAVERDGLGCDIMNLAADDNCMDIKSRDLIQEVFPDITDIRGDLAGYETLYSNAKAKALLGWQPVHHWRDYVS